MIIKKMDSKQEEIEELEIFLKGELTPYQRSSIKSELEAIKKGASGEKNSAYYINFYFEDSENWAVIHDLRLEHKGKVAQIDHLLINRFFDIYVLESKHYSYKLKIISEEDFEIYDGKQYIGIESPIEQNKRHIHLLGRFLKDENILPKRMGISVRPRFKNFILVSPKSIIIRPPENKFDTSCIIKANTLRTKIDEETDKWNPLKNMATVSNICSSSTLDKTARRLAAFHKPIKIDFRAKFGLPVQKDKIKGRR